MRDLIFHVQEHRFTIPQINEALEELELVFMGFEFLNNIPKEAFKKAYPKQGMLYDLDKWHEYDTLKLGLPVEYPFWTQKL